MGKCKKLKYNNKIGAAEQVDAEEEIAAHLFDNMPEKMNDDWISEEDAAKFGREILYLVLRRFRPDFFAC